MRGGNNNGGFHGISGRTGGGTFYGPPLMGNGINRDRERDQPMETKELDGRGKTIATSTLAAIMIVGLVAVCAYLGCCGCREKRKRRAPPELPLTEIPPPSPLINDPYLITPQSTQKYMLPEESPSPVETAIDGMKPKELNDRLMREFIERVKRGKVVEGEFEKV